MTAPFEFAVTGLTALDAVGELGPKVRISAVRAINRTAQRARTASARRIHEQVALPVSYLNRPDRLGITRKASGSSLEARITGRHRATSLARFAVGSTQRRTGGARVMVQPGLATFLPKAFFVNLKSGNTDGKNNRGLAIRLPDGQRPDRAYKPQPLGRGAWLIYGPSVDQVFDDVAVEIGPETADFLEHEFVRLTGL